MYDTIAICFSVSPKETETDESEKQTGKEKEREYMALSVTQPFKGWVRNIVLLLRIIVFNP